MAGSYIAYDNLVTDSNVALAGGTVTAGSLANLGVRQLSKVVQLKATAGSVPVIDIHIGSGAANYFNMIGIINANYDVNGSSPYPYDVIVHQSPDGSSYSFLGHTDNANDFSVKGVPKVNFFYLLDTPATYEYIRLYLSWQQTDGFWQFGRLWIGNAIYLPNGIEKEYTFGKTDDGKLSLSRGGQAYASKGKVKRTLTVSARVDLEQAFGFTEGALSATYTPNFDAMGFEAGLTSEIIVLPRTSSNLLTRRQGIYGHYPGGKGPTIRSLPGDNYQVEFEIEEEN